jgi:Spy/CpxP family protein refolding chaperone
MKKRNLLYLIIIITLVNLSALGTMIYQRWLNPETTPKIKGREARFEQVKQNLSLTQIQSSRFEEIRKIFHTGLDSLDNQMEEMRQQLLQEIWQSQITETHIDTLLFKISQIQMESQRLVIWHFYQFKEVLTPEQWQIFYTFVSKRFPSHDRFSGSRK